MTLTTARLLLRQPETTDTESIFKIHSDPRTNQHNPAGPMKRSAEATKLLETWQKHWLEQGYGYWAVTRLEAPETAIGFGGVMKKQITSELYDNNLYFRFRPDAWGQGYASEMVEAALAATFTRWAQPRVLAFTRPHNVPSQKTLERAGFRPIKTVNDVPGDTPSLLYRLERQQFVERRAA